MPSRMSPAASRRESLGERGIHLSGAADAASGCAPGREDRRGLLMARPRPHERHTPVVRAIGTAARLRRAAEVEVCIAGIAYGPAALPLPQVGDRLLLFRFLGHKSYLYAPRRIIRSAHCLRSATAYGA